MKWARRHRARLRAALRAALGAYRLDETTTLTIRIPMPAVTIRPKTFREREALAHHARVSAGVAAAQAVHAAFPMKIPKGRAAREAAGGFYA